MTEKELLTQIRDGINGLRNDTYIHAHNAAGLAQLYVLLFGLSFVV